MQLELSDEEEAALLKELHDIVERDRYFLSPRIRSSNPGRLPYHVSDKAKDNAYTSFAR
jgi:hypothetical protein